MVVVVVVVAAAVGSSVVAVVVVALPRQLIRFFPLLNSYGVETGARDLESKLA